MTEHHPTISFPFGRDCDTLILCKNDDHRRRVIKALKIPAQYELVSSALAGSRFKKIILIGCRPDSETERTLFDRLLKEYLPTKLDVGCTEEIYVI